LLDQGNGFGVLIDSRDIVTLSNEVGEVAASAGACVEDAHTGLDATAHELIDEVDIGGTKLRELG